MFDEIYEKIEETRHTHEIKFIFINPPQEVLNSRNQKNLRSGYIPNSPGLDLIIDYPKRIDLELNGIEEFNSNIWNPLF